MIDINIKKVAHFLFWFLACLIAVNLLFLVSKYHFNLSLPVSIYNLFNFDREANIPTLFSVLLLLFSGIAFLLNRFFEQDKKLFKGWAIISILFLYLSVDEGSQIHESIMDIIRIFYHGSGAFYFVWVIPAIALVATLFVVLFRFYFLLPESFRKQLLIGFSVYLAGAIIMEMVGGFYVSNFGDASITYPLFIVIEESLEIFGSIIILIASLNNLKNSTDSISAKLS